MTGGERLRLEARLEERRRTVLRLLRAKFGPLSADAESRVTSADETTLDQWLDRVLTATRLAEIWGES